MQEVTLMQMLDARERRVWEQQELLRAFGKPIVCFTMNIPGPVKDSPLIRKCFRYGLTRLEAAIQPEKRLKCQCRQAVTGCEAMLAVDLKGEALKKICVTIEDDTPLGRLFDMDVLVPGGKKLDRELVGGGSRDCIVCGAPGRGCASRRIHSVEQLQQAAWSLMRQAAALWYAEEIGGRAHWALLAEVNTTPKPGLVDRRNSGSHRDMNLDTFHRSADALHPYLVECVRVGQQTAGSGPEETFAFLRKAGIRAEKEMYAATNGINTHKGAIFTMGLLCGALGRLWNPDADVPRDRVFREVAAMTAKAMEADFACQQGKTAGERIYAASGIRGVRGEAAAGLPSVAKIGVPVFERLRAQGLSANDAGVTTLLHMICQVEDTNLRHRGGEKLAAEAVNRVQSLLSQDFSMTDVEALDDWFIEKNLSPGGCADLLAAVYFISDLEG